MTLALVQRFVTNQGDAWEYTLDYLEPLLRGPADRERARRTDGDAHGGFLALIATLGRRVAELHAALARPSDDAAFDAGAAQRRRRRGVRRAGAPGGGRDLQRCCASGSGSCPPRRAPKPKRCWPRRQSLEARLDASGIAAAGSKTRFHGDLHLGQVLVTGNDFVIIDFEGEPARSFDERRAKSSPLRDVAGMLRSFDYARWSALRRVAHDPAEIERFAPVLRDWHQATRAAFLDAYSQALASALPAAPVDSGLLALFELEKALYELRYELNNRVDWAQVPLQGIATLASAGPRR